MFVVYGANFGTLARTCDAAGACLVLPNRPAARAALDKGNPHRFAPHVHWVDRALPWLRDQFERADTDVLGVELSDAAIRLADLEPVRRRTVIVLGHEHHGLPDEALPFLDTIVQIPMLGVGASLNVAVAGSLVLYKAAGLS